MDHLRGGHSRRPQSLFSQIFTSGVNVPVDLNPCNRRLGIDQSLECRTAVRFIPNDFADAFEAPDYSVAPDIVLTFEM